MNLIHCAEDHRRTNCLQEASTIFGRHHFLVDLEAACDWLGAF